eukprot:3987876-Amphidinium_carterae.2
MSLRVVEVHLLRTQASTYNLAPPSSRQSVVSLPQVMPYVGSMFLSDTAMMRPGTRYVKDCLLLQKAFARIVAEPLDQR